MVPQVDMATAERVAVCVAQEEAAKPGAVQVAVASGGAEVRAQEELVMAAAVGRVQVDGEVAGVEAAGVVVVVTGGSIALSLHTRVRLQRNRFPEAQVKIAFPRTRETHRR